VLLKRSQGVGESEEIVVTLTNVQGRQVALRVRSDDSFYFDELSAGTWTAQLQVEGRTCAIRFDVPEHREPYFELGDVACETP
jgi:hypothetical protein